MQFAYQFPEIIERLVLVSSGGLGSEVSRVLRAASLLGAELFIAGTAGPGRTVGSAVGRGLAAVGMRPRADVAEVAAGTPHSPIPTVAPPSCPRCGVVGTDGQRVHAGDRLYLAEGVPILIIWGQNDPMIPVHHAQEAHRAIPGSRLEIFDGVGHLPQLEAPGRFVAVLERFLVETEPAQWDIMQWRARLIAASEEFERREGAVETGATDPPLTPAEAA